MTFRILRAYFVFVSLKCFSQTIGLVQVPGILVSETQCKGSNTSSIRSLVMGEERIDASTRYTGVREPVYEDQHVFHQESGGG